MDISPSGETKGHPLANYQFSSDELRVLRECNSESFFQRSLPLGTGFGVAAYFAVKNGYIRPNVKYGAVPKVVVGVIVGYFMGKFSYQQKCAEKLMRLPNSKLAEVLRQRKKDGVMGSLKPDQNLSVGLALAPFAPSVDVYSDVDVHSGSLNLDTESRPTISGLDDIYRPSLDTPSQFFEAEIPLEPAKPNTSYDELRKRNREDYGKRQHTYTRSLTEPSAPAQNESPKTILDDEQSFPVKRQTNKYGDSWTG